MEESSAQLMARIVSNPKVLTVALLILALQILTPYVFMGWIVTSYAPQAMNRADKVIENTDRIMEALANCRQCWREH